MATEFYLPDIGEGLTEVVVLSWYVEVGDSVGLDDVLVQVETDKAVVDIPSPVAGVVLFHGAEPDTELEVGKLLAVVGDPGETWTPAAKPEPQAPVATPAAPIVGTLSDDAELIQAAPRLLPADRKLAADLGVDLTSISPTGPGGRITESDIRAAAHTVGDSRPTERVRMSATRRAIADNLAKSWREIPHVTTYGEADTTAVLAERAATGKPPLEAIFIRRLIPVLQAFPAFNASLDGHDLVLRKYFDVGVAVDAPDGLMVAVVRDADQLTAEALGQRITELAAAVRSRKAAADEMRGQTFTLSNIGAVGGRFGTPIVPYGTTAILSVGRGDPQPAVIDGQLGIRSSFPLSLSYDHRAIDGSTGRAFLAAVIEAIEAP
ncbi:MAG: 2-oxo acid dehydrogenase subunit E2 [Acidimicrobiia bacterium]|nr:2-oxo acid dehydrogenase subunit E2 [Acidimicrobiia bacterium]